MKPPGLWKEAVLSVVVTCQVVGSVVPTFQTRARSVVGEVPSVWSRIWSLSPAA